jgi:hypothetical protein
MDIGPVSWMIETIMGAFKAVGFAAFMIALAAISLLILVVMIGAHLGDGILIAISVLACLAGLAWGVTGARLLSKWRFVTLLIPAIMVGVFLLLTASRRYPPFHPYLLGVAAALAFVVIGCALSWRSVQPLAASLASDALDLRRGDILAVGGICFFIGVLFFQPAIILLNGQSDARSPLVLTGTVARMYQTHGKGAADYIVLTGPAAAYNSTGAAGEFAVPANVYREIGIGDRRCLTVHTGAMRFQWWTLEGC